MSVIVVGGGKMGLSHLAIASRYAGKRNTVLCDTGRIVRFGYSRLGWNCISALEPALAGKRRPLGVIVATPTGAHFAIARMALEAGVACFVEKPLTLDVDRSALLVKLAEDRGIPAQTGFVLRYCASFGALRRVVAGGELGRVKSYAAKMAGNVITRSGGSDWRTDFSRGGGCLNEYGPHLLDLCRFVFGDVAAVTEAEKGQVHSRLADDRMRVRWSHRDGAEGLLELDWCDPAQRKSVLEIRVEFEKGRARVDNSAIDFAFGASADGAVRARLAAPVLPPPVGYYLRGEEFSLQMEDFLASCGALASPTHRPGPRVAASLRDGLEVDRLIDTIARTSGLK